MNFTITIMKCIHSCAVFTRNVSRHGIVISLKALSSSKVPPGNCHRERIFHSYGDVSIAGEGLQILTYARHSWPLSSEGS